MTEVTEVSVGYAIVFVGVFKFLQVTEVPEVSEVSVGIFR